MLNEILKGELAFKDTYASLFVAKITVLEHDLE